MLCYSIIHWNHLVVYDDDLTDALFDVVLKLFQTKSKLQSVYITIEKRINFYTETLSIECPAYDYFLEKLTELKTNDELLIIEQLGTDVQSINQCTSIYKRTKELVRFNSDDLSVFDRIYFQRFCGIFIILIGSLDYSGELFNRLGFVNFKRCNKGSSSSDCVSSPVEGCSDDLKCDVVK